jgi:maltose O-acetyltransferase
MRVRRLFVFVVIFVIQRIRVFVYKYIFSDNKAALKNVKINQPVRFCGKGRIIISDCEIGVYRSPKFVDASGYIEARKINSSIQIGNSTFINNTVSIIAYEGSITIGNKCLIGSDVLIINSDFHVLSFLERGRGNVESRDVYIGNDVFIGNNVKVLKGVSIGDGAVVGCGSVVNKNVDAGTIVSGNPAQYLKKVSHEHG